MKYEKHDVQGKAVAVVHTTQQLGTVESRSLRETIDSIVGEEVYNVIVNLQHTTYIGSMGIGAIVSNIAKCKSNDGSVRLAGASGGVLDSLRTTNIDRIIKIYDSVEDALGDIQ